MDCIVDEKATVWWTGIEVLYDRRKQSYCMVDGNRGTVYIVGNRATYCILDGN